MTTTGPVSDATLRRKRAVDWERIRWFAFEWYEAASPGRVPTFCERDPACLRPFRHSGKCWP